MSSRKKVNVLLVDDDVNSCEVIADILKSMGYGCRICHNGLEGLEEIKKNSYDVVLSDIKMPKMNGVKMVREIKKINLNVPIIMMTAFRKEDPVQRALDEIAEQGIRMVIYKPFKIEEVLKLIEEITGKKRSK